jgi:hypothetical protein
MSTDAVLAECSRLTGSLADWCSRYGHVLGHTPGGCAYVVASMRPGETESWELFHLADYAVSTVSGPTYYLVPRS